MTHIHTCDDCDKPTSEPYALVINKYLARSHVVCAECNDDYTTCAGCGIDVHSDNACPLTDEEDGCESYGCAPCAGYLSTSYGYVKDT